MGNVAITKERYRSMLLLGATAALWSIGGLLIKLVDAGPLAIAGARASITIVILLIFIRKPKFNWSVPQLGAALCSTITALLFVTANKTTTAANAILLQSTAPIYVAILGALFLKERTRLYDWITILIVMGGMGLFFIDGLSTEGLFGNICAILSGVSFALFTIFMRMQKNGSPLESVLLGNILTAIIGLPFLSRSMPSVSGWIFIAILGIFQLGIPYFMYAAAIKHTTALEAVLIPVIEPILNPIWVFLILGETPGTSALIGGSIVLAAITLKCVLAVVPAGSISIRNRGGSGNMLEQIKNRRSIRKYENKPVEEEKVTQMLESARLAPSGSNTQPWHFIVIRSEAMKQKIAEAAHNQKWMLTAPVFIACIADIRARVKEDANIEIDESSPQAEVKQIIRDTAIAIEHMVLTAEHLGLGTCWVSDFLQKDIRPVIGVSADKYVVTILTVGYAEEHPGRRPRKALEEIVHYESWH